MVLYHLMGWAWLPLAFPSMGVMFALAGNLMARSLKRPAVQVVRGRLRRLLPPMWLLGAVGITGMLAQGWGPDSDGHPAWWWGHLLFWVVPLSDPPYAAGLPGIHHVLGDNWGANLAEPLWYLRAYLWFVLLSPLFRTLLRRAAWPTILAPVALCRAPGVRGPRACPSASTPRSPTSPPSAPAGSSAWPTRRASLRQGCRTIWCPRSPRS